MFITVDLVTDETNVNKLTVEEIATILFALGEIGHSKNYSRKNREDALRLYNQIRSEADYR